MEKFCRICNVMLTNNNTHSSSIKKRNYICKKCTSEKGKKYYLENKEKVTNSNRNWRTKNYTKVLEDIREWRKRNRGKVNVALRKYKQKNPEKVIAHHAISNGIQLGKVERQPCIVCGSTKMLEAHHEDYTKPLDVVWFCKRHHVNYHSNNRPAKQHEVNSGLATRKRGEV